MDVVVKWGPSRPPCADCGDDEDTIYFPFDGEWACDHPGSCMERQRDQAQEQLREAVGVLRVLERGCHEPRCVLCHTTDGYHKPDCPQVRPTDA